MGLKDVRICVDVQQIPEIKSDQNGIESSRRKRKNRPVSSAIKSDQNGIESCLVYSTSSFVDLMIKSDQNGIERTQMAGMVLHLQQDKIRPKWD